MMKKILITGLFALVFAAALGAIYMMRNEGMPEEKVPAAAVKAQEINDSAHTYTVEGLSAACTAGDKIFCAIERTVKCTMAPELDGCDKNAVPSFVLGKTEEAARPTQMTFEIVKIKPQAESRDISVYTKSDCDAVWFGLCKGTVIYSLSPKDDGEWAVTNIYALEQ